MTTMLSVKNLHSGYGKVPVLRGVNMEIATNEVVGIIGANGAGKTTLVRSICGLLPVSAGSVVKQYTEITNLQPHHLPRHRLAVVLENRNLFGDLTVKENLYLSERAGRKNRTGSVRFSLNDVMELFPIVKEKYYTPVQLLSGGQQQMVAIARALLLQPDLLLMDEPSTGLSPKIVKDIITVLHKLKAMGMSMVLVEQTVSIAAQITDRAYVMSLGSVVHEVRKGEWQTFMQDDSLIKTYLGG